MLFLVLEWLAFGLAVAPIVAGMAWLIAEGVILPRLIPRSEIERLTEDIMKRRPDDPEGAAFIEEHAAWHRSQSREQGKWRRVRREIRRRLERRTLDYDTVAPPLTSLPPSSPRERRAAAPLRRRQSSFLRWFRSMLRW